MPAFYAQLISYAFQWIDVKPVNNSLGIFRVTRRLRSRNTWEPLYIGTNDEPLYDERLTWDGKRDKMSQVFDSVFDCIYI